jgi:hypothetical protein
VLQAASAKESTFREAEERIVQQRRPAIVADLEVRTRLLPPFSSSRSAAIALLAYLVAICLPRGVSLPFTPRICELQSQFLIPDTVFSFVLLYSQEMEPSSYVFPFLRTQLQQIAGEP